jgi:hypothetical protein
MQRQHDPGGNPRYPVRVLAQPRPARDGLVHGPDDRPERLAWCDVRAAVAAEVGEPEGVRTIVFDLIVARPDGGLEALRTDAEPGEDAMALARTIEAGLEAGQAPCLSIKSLARDALPARRYPDLDAFEEDAVAWVEAALRERRTGVR